MLANARWRLVDPSATLGMTKGRVVAEGGLVRRKENCRSLGYARDDKGEKGC
jgi:hypothetical protein